MSENKHEIFSTPIWGGVGVFEDNYLKQLEATILEMSKKLPNRDKSNFLGWQSPDDLYKYEWLDPALKLIGNLVNDIKSDLKTDAELKIDSMWANVNFPNAVNIKHIHGGEFAGVFYVKVPEGDCGRLILTDPRPRVSMSEKLTNRGDFPLDPIERAAVIFPAWLEHYVEPNKTNDTRISISFNISRVPSNV